jgi:hypothetical protein
MEAYTNGYIEGKYKPDYFKTLLHENELHGRNWLFSYEMSVKGWLNPEDKEEYVKKDKFYNKLFENNIEFYHIDKEDEIEEDDWLTALFNDDTEDIIIKPSSVNKSYFGGGSSNY